MANLSDGALSIYFFACLFAALTMCVWNHASHLAMAPARSTGGGDARIITVAVGDGGIERAERSGA